MNLKLNGHGYEYVRLAENLSMAGMEEERILCIDELHARGIHMTSRLNSWHVMKQSISLRPPQLRCSFHLENFQKLPQIKPENQANGQNGDPFQLATFPNDYQLVILTYQTPKRGKVSPDQQYQKRKTEN